MKVSEEMQNYLQSKRAQEINQKIYENSLIAIKELEKKHPKYKDES